MRIKKRRVRVSGKIVLGTQPVTGSHKGLVLVWHQVVPEGDHVAPASTQRRRMWSPWRPVPVLDDLNPRCRAVPGDQGGTGGTLGSSHTGRTSRLTVVATTLMKIKGLVTKGIILRFCSISETDILFTDPSKIKTEIIKKQIQIAEPKDREMGVS